MLKLQLCIRYFILNVHQIHIEMEIIMKRIKTLIQLFISIKKKSDVYNVGMFVFEHQSLSCLLNCSATVTRKLLDV